LAEYLAALRQHKTHNGEVDKYGKDHGDDVSWTSKPTVNHLPQQYNTHSQSYCFGLFRSRQLSPNCTKGISMLN